MSIRVVVVDDQALIRGGFAAIVDSEPDLEVVGQFGDGDAAIQAVRTLLPDVVLMDLRMPGRDGLSATAVITGEPALAGVRVVVLTTFEADENVLAALQAGAAGFLGKDITPADLVAGIRTVAGGEALLSPRATRTLIQTYLAAPTASTRPVDENALAVLTQREREVLTLVGRGMSNDDIAATLVVSPHTAKTHVNRAMSKLGVRDRAQLVVLAFRAGLVRTTD